MIQIQQIAQQYLATAEQSQAISQLNAVVLGAEVAWFTAVLEARMLHYFEKDHALDISDLAAPDLSESQSLYAQFVLQNQFNQWQRLALILAMLPHIKPEALDLFYIKNQQLDKRYPEFGGWNGKSHSGFLPTIETFLFVVAGGDLVRRFSALAEFDDESPLVKYRVISLNSEHQDEPFTAAALRLSGEYLTAFTTGMLHKPHYSSAFPAKRLTTPLEWQDLVLPSRVMEELNQLLSWISHQRQIMQMDIAKNLKPGFRALLYGPPGTGKSLTAALVGKHCDMDVYRVDLSALVSKYIGETEKNLAGVFDQAESKNWILFFDEADALFGARTQTQSSNDRHANQEVAYLLQRIEDFPGVVILASNIKDNIDIAFIRRFQAAIYFPMPDAKLRQTLWQNMLGEQNCQQREFDLPELADSYQLSGGAMTNVVRNSALLAIRQGRTQLSSEDIHESAQREMRKEGKSI
ncbi:ATP-binding protein [Agarivorans sp. DSG3-1]|uniref:ATP-binding protein n=1 Tax=Agarivorans sp. DSG3-1 TaxID=3342249 RepID=UPI00398F64DA